MKHFVITIGRTCGSGGKEIANLLAEELQVKCYDKNLLTEISKQSGLCEEIVEMNDEIPNNSLIYSIAMNPYAMSTMSNFNMPLNNKLFLAQFDTIRTIAERESCVFLGRCADYILEGMDGLVTVFIDAEDEDRCAHIIETDKVPENKVSNYIRNIDKKRAGYYNYYTDKKWGQAKAYDLCINSSKVGYAGAVAIIKAFLEEMKNKESEE